MFGIQGAHDDGISPIRRTLRLGAVVEVGGEKRKRENSLSPVKKRLKTKGVKRPPQDDVSPVLRVKRPRIEKHRLRGEARSDWRVASPVKRNFQRRSSRITGSIITRQTVSTNLGKESGELRKTGNSTTAFPSSNNTELVSPASTLISTSGHQHGYDESVPRPPLQPAPHLPPTSARVGGANVCNSCPRRFPSHASLEYHQNLKIRALRKCKILSARFSADLHLAICPIRTCCYTSDRVEDMQQHLTERHRQAGKQYMVGEDGTMTELYVILKHSPSEKGTISCPACQRHFNSRNNLIRHQSESCRGYGQHNCVICSAHFRERRQMINHMKTAHPPPPGVVVTGMFTGKQKYRKAERSERSINASAIEPLSQFTFIPEQPIVTSALEFFTPSTAAGLTWLIQRARGSSGNSILRLNVSSLIRRGESRNLIPFETQAKLIGFSASESPAIVSSR